MKKLACLFLILAASGCPDVKVDPDETDPTKLPPPGPTVEFDPSNKIVPFPNNLLLDPTTGKLSLPAQCGETPTAKALREGVLNKLDGFGLYKPSLTVTFTEDVDASSLMGHVALYKRTTGTTAVDPATATPIPVVTVPAPTVRFDASCQNPKMVPQVIIVPLVPLEQKSNYVVALLDGIKTAKGEPFNASGTWLLVRSKDAPVVFKDGVVSINRTPLDPAKPEDLATLQGIDLLWKAHAGAVKFLADDLPADKQQSRDKILLAWEFKTQTSTDPLDPAVTGSLASTVDRTKLNLNASITTQINFANPPFNTCPVSEMGSVQCFIKISIGQGSYATGNAACAALGCATIGDVLVSTLDSKQYQIDTPNPYTGTGAKPIPGPWGDPIAPAAVKTETINAFVTVPATAAPATGYPVVVFQHALGQSRTTLLAIAGRLASLGYAAVAIDAVGHDSRAVRISNNAALNCADSAQSQRPDGGPSPVSFPQCYAPFLSPNLAATRDGIRQTVLDQQRLVAALKACGTTDCNALKVDGNHILYLGQSLGSIIGGISTSVTTDIKASVLNVAGVDWVDILENTQTLPIQCQLVDGLIDAGILVGQKSNLAAMPPTGLCTTPDWKTQPGYLQFKVIGRWVLDPADPVNFTRKLATRKFLIQEVVGDTVVPNSATMTQGTFVQLMPGTADPVTAAPPPLPAASMVITTNPTTSKWVRYPEVTTAPGNKFGHSSLLQPPAGSGIPGQLGTVRMQVDALTYLVANQ